MRFLRIYVFPVSQVVLLVILPSILKTVCAASTLITQVASSLWFSLSVTVSTTEAAPVLVPAIKVTTMVPDVEPAEPLVLMLAVPLVAVAVAVLNPPSAVKVKLRSVLAPTPTDCAAGAVTLGAALVSSSFLQEVKIAKEATMAKTRIFFIFILI